MGELAALASGLNRLDRGNFTFPGFLFDVHLE
jgi:hypothetical protein